jgi:alpha-amylase
VDVTFQTTHTTEWGESVWVVGSLKELGEWSTDGAFMLTGSSQGSTTAWSGTISLPANQGVGFKFVKLQVDGTPAWEEDPDRGLDTPSCGESAITAGGSWHGEDSEPSCDAVEVSFEVRATTEYGEGIFVVGPSTQLGEWDTARAIALSPDNYPLWKQSVSMPLGQEGQFKYVKQQIDGSFLWEAYSNREFVAPDSCQPVATREDTWQN